MEELKKGMEFLTRKLEQGEWILCFYLQRNAYFLSTEYCNSDVVFSIDMSNLISNHIVIVTDNLVVVMSRIDMEDGGGGVEEGNRILNEEVGGR